MSQYCNGLCELKHETTTLAGNPNHKGDAKHWPVCRTCNVRINWHGRLCPCCVLPLSCRSRSKSMIECKIFGRKQN